MTEEKKCGRLDCPNEVVNAKYSVCAEHMAEEFDTCACGEVKPQERVGCDDCEEAAHVAFAAARPEPVLPPNWWRKFEPIGGCAAAYNYGRSDLTGQGHTLFGSHKPRSEDDLVYACKYGIEINDSGATGGHLLPSEVEGLVVVLRLAVEDHLALKAFENPEHDDSCGYGEVFEKAVAEAAAVRLRAKASSPP